MPNTNFIIIQKLLCFIPPQTKRKILKLLMFPINKKKIDFLKYQASDEYLDLEDEIIVIPVQSVPNRT